MNRTKRSPLCRTKPNNAARAGNTVQLLCLVRRTVILSALQFRICSTTLSTTEGSWGLIFSLGRKMGGKNNYVPPAYIPLGQSDSEPEVLPHSDDVAVSAPPAIGGNGPVQWSSGICACCDDMQSCCIGLVCPCFLFGRNAEFLGSGTMMGSCTTHFILWALVNTVCCLLTDGVLLGLPGCFVACYACGYRKALRSKYNLQEAPCGDFVSHFFCHLCAVCQEYREIRERSGGSNAADLNLVAVTAPPVQTMESASTQ